MAKMTLERLARMVARGFEKTPTKHEIAARFDTVDDRLLGVENRLDAVESRLGRLHPVETAALGEIRARLAALERKVGLRK